MQKMMQKEDTMMDKDMMKDDSMMDKDDIMTEKQKIREAKKMVVRAKIESRISHLSDEQIETVLERIEAYRVRIVSQSMSDTKRATYNELLDIIQEVLIEGKMMQKDTMMEK